MHVTWPAPLFFMGEIPAADVVYIMAAAVIFALAVVLALGPSLRGRKTDMAVVTAPEAEMPRV